MKDYIKRLDPDQQKAALAPIGNVATFAIAGAGKTTVLISRVGHMIDSGIPEEEILLVTFTRKAANEMVERIKKFLGRDHLKLQAGTFHSIAAKYLRIYWNYTDRKENFTIIEPEESTRLVGKIRAVYTKEVCPEINEFPKANIITGLISSRRNHCVSWKRILEKTKNYDLMPIINHLSNIEEAYHLLKKESNVFDFDDLMEHFLQLLKNDEARAKLQKKMKHILVDEYQDINPTQHEIIRLLSSGSLFVIGDASQCIYQFRGSVDKYIDQFVKEYEGAVRYDLTYNYRSTPEVLKLAEDSIRNNNRGYDIVLNTKNERGNLPIIVETQDSDDQAEFIARTVKGNYMDKLSDVAVLVRTRMEMRAIEKSLFKRDIPYTLVGGMSLLEGAHTKRLLEILNFIANPNLVTFEQFAILFDKIGAKGAEKLWNKYVEFLKDPTNEELPKKLKLKPHEEYAVKTIWKIQSKNGQPVEDIISVIFEDFLKKYIQNTFEDPEDRIEDIEYLMLTSEEYGTELSRFLEETVLSATELTEKKQETGKNAVTIITMHRAKGLEWDYVFIPGFTKERFPAIKNGEPPYKENMENVRNERNLLYVAITRAKKELFISFTNAHPFKKYYVGPSEFIKEFGKETYETATTLNHY